MASFIAKKYDCNVKHANAGITILDPCNCSTYYLEDKKGWKRYICPGEKLWNFNVNRCMEPKTVFYGNLCDPVHPWERCQGLTDRQRNNLIRKCMQEGSYTGPFDVTHADTSAHETGPTLVSRETQLANVHLMFASMFAGCVITLIVVAMLMEFCNFTRTSMKMPAKNEKSSDKPMRVAGSEVHATDGESGSAMYDDIEEEVIPNTEIKPGCPNRRGRTPAKLQTHMVPKTKSKPTKKEKGGNIERPPRPPQFEHKESVGYIHPVYH